MNTNKLLLLLAIVVCLGLFGWTSSAQKKHLEITKWEYQSTNGLTDEKLNELGAQGWELIGATAFSNGTSSYTTLYFKRPK